MAFRAVGLPRSLAPPPPGGSNHLYYKNRGHTPDKRRQIYRFLQLGWSPNAIAEQVGVGKTTVYDFYSNVKEYDCPTKPTHLFKTLGRPTKVTEENAEALYEELAVHGWMYQDEIVYWLFIERGVLV
ncbi:hypothetical protein K469DRAFT_709879, partial [Zopfia rhizophila CBS 207.26]